MGDVYEAATLTFPLVSIPQGAAAAWDWISAPDATGHPLGCWRTEIGPLGRLLIVRRFDDDAALARERHRALMSASPFNAGSHITGLEMDTYVPFPFLPPMTAEAGDAIHEFRTYRLKAGGLAETLAGWRAAIGPARAYTAHLRINMYALDGPPRITHVWGFESLAERATLRSAAYAAGVWPPKGGPENIVEAMSVIALREF